eukprot:1678948-Amphidinium_carterae.2
MLRDRVPMRHYRRKVRSTSHCMCQAYVEVKSGTIVLMQVCTGFADSLHPTYLSTASVVVSPG